LNGDEKCGRANSRGLKEIEIARLQIYYHSHSPLKGKMQNMTGLVLVYQVG